MRLASLLGALFLTIAVPLYADAPDPYPHAARSYLLVRDDQILWQRAPTLQLQPASLAKLLTALVVLETDWKADRWLTVSAYAASVPPSRLGLKAGEQITAGAALAAMLIRSANDACRVLVEGFSANLTAFRARMTAQAVRLGMTDSNFVDPCGFDADGQHSTVADLLKLAQAARAVPLIAHLGAMPEAQLTTRAGRIIKFNSTNALLGRLAGAQGLKTGNTSQAGQCLIAYVRRQDHEVWLVMLGGTQRWWLAHGMIEDAFAGAD
ncbi:D-alanyl-D-alanine carboxypeptidase [Steroidobacter sp. S1-65]|uniref:D-alanyl-D-alanine carboxypeptidase n=1 Tax=Steroidobacter gossypii TaxID=2805490 RepID=A0ABS1WYY9_9GAMM|nr:serine hydrolase [Steroidobacter gossypii]MBM0106137.1 D-alanyl-D-alanine carboxypeptidase [Steroidobacter gossypii]